MLANVFRLYLEVFSVVLTPMLEVRLQRRQEAERQLQQAARQDGILQAADQNARSTITPHAGGIGLISARVPLTQG